MNGMKGTTPVNPKTSILKQLVVSKPAKAKPTSVTNSETQPKQDGQNCETEM